MHKIFAKPLFLGKKVIFLTDCHSTNDELSALLRKSSSPEGLVIYTDHQRSGKGQRGNVWLDEPGKNVLMSVLLKPTYLKISDQHLLNVVIGLSIIRSVGRYLGEERVKLKWPNDVLIDSKKICGILVENTLQGETLENSIMGIGFNLNQKAFGLPNATSLTMQTGEEYSRKSFIENLLVDIEYFLLKLKNGQQNLLLQLYHEKLYLKGVTSSFQDESGEFTGTILGIDNTGKLIVSKGGSLCNYGIKEIKFLS
ncbi:MAG: biotin--[acetyl-CoA-carboxylase] ligase [Cyclobacteriaceae bacterium]